MSAADVLAQAVARVRSHPAEAYQWRIENSPTQLLSLGASWAASAGLGAGSISTYTHSGGTIKLGLVRIGDRVYVQTGSDCYVNESTQAAADHADSLRALLADPDQVFASLRPVTFDLSTLQLRATMPLSLAAPLLLIGNGPLGTVNLDSLTGRVPVTVSIDADGPIDTITIDSDDLVKQVRGLAHRQPELLAFVSSFHDLLFTDLGATDPPTSPPAQQLASSAGQGCDAQPDLT